MDCITVELSTASGIPDQEGLEAGAHAFFAKLGVGSLICCLLLGALYLWGLTSAYKEHFTNHPCVSI